MSFYDPGRIHFGLISYSLLLICLSVFTICLNLWSRDKGPKPMSGSRTQGLKKAHSSIAKT